MTPSLKDKMENLELTHDSDKTGEKQSMKQTREKKEKRPNSTRSRLELTNCTYTRKIHSHKFTIKTRKPTQST